MQKMIRLVAILIAATMLAPVSSSAEPAHPMVCGGQAPATSSCTIQHEDAVIGAALVWVYPAFGAYRGRIRVRLMQGTTAKVDIYCDYTGDLVKDIEGDNPVSSPACKTLADAFPGENADYTQVCNSYDYGTFTGKGSGVWTCGHIGA